MGWLVWVKFIVCVVIILFAGARLARYGDVIAEKTGLGGIWIGLVLLAVITSVPELVTSVSAAALVSQPDLAIGNLFGSCLFNLAILALLDILHRRIPILSEVRLRHIASAGVSILLIAIAGGCIFPGEKISRLALGWLGLPSIIILLVYLLAVWRIFRFERNYKLQVVEVASSRYEDVSMREVWLKFALASAAVIGAGIWVSFIGDEIARTYAWSATFVGSLFLAMSTSMPELVVSIAALRLGALDMAVADILGSNMFNIAIIFPVDLFYSHGVIFSMVSNVNIITVGVMILMSVVVIIGLWFRQKRKTFVLASWYTLVLIGLYICSAYALFRGVGSG